MTFFGWRFALNIASKLVLEFLTVYSTCGYFALNTAGKLVLSLSEDSAASVGI